MSRVFARAAFRTLYRVHILHADRVPASGGVLLVCNHESFLDPPAIACFIAPRPTSSMAREGLFRVPLLGWLIRALGAVPVKGDGTDAGTIRECIRRLQEGHALFVFPEGARTHDGDIAPFRRGTLLLLRRAGVPVLPVAVGGLFRAWPRTKRFPGRFGSPIGVNYGEPIPAESLADLPPDEALARLRAAVAALRAELEAVAGITPPAAAPRSASPSEGATRTDS